MEKLDKLSQWLRGATGEDSRSQASSEKKAAPEKPRSKKGPAGGSKPQHFFKNAPREAVQKKAPSKAAVRHKLPTHEKTMRIIPVGGCEEVGKNCMVVEYEKDILVIDMGFQFPEDELFGVDYIIPDIQYLKERRQRIRGILITHGHLDHIGALPFVMPDLGFPPIYGTKLSLGLCERILEEHKLLKQCKLIPIDPVRDKGYSFGQFKVDFFRVNHSIPDSVGMAISSPAGTMVHTGDFKFDFTPADGVECDIDKMANLGRRGVQVMFSDSTNATKPGHTLSEREVAHNLEKSIHGVQGRIIIACFASLIGRIQQIIDLATQENRKIFLSGRSMIRNVELGMQLGFIKVPKGMLKEIRSVNDYPDNQVLILTTGSQGEPMAALSRMATGCHAQVSIQKGDNIVLSASPIIGNEKSVAFLVDNLSRLGAHVIHNRIMDVHTSGHGCQEDLKLMMTLIKPQHLVPIHGSFYMRRAHGDLGPAVGISDKHIHMMDNGNVIEIRDRNVSFKHEDIKTKFVVIDGLGQGEMGSQVHSERESMAQNGIVSIMVKMRKGKVVGKPLVTTHGFLYQKELDKVVNEISEKARRAVTKLHQRNKRPNAHDYENAIRSSVAGYIMQHLNRRPLISSHVLHV